MCHLAGAAEVDFRASSMSTLIQMVRGGLGITLVPELALGVEDPDDSLIVRSFGKRSPGRTIGLAYRRSSTRAHEFKILAEYFEKP